MFLSVSRAPAARGVEAAGTLRGPAASLRPSLIMHSPCAIASTKSQGRLFLIDIGIRLWHKPYMHTKFIDSLGGYKWLAAQLNLKPNRVRMWKSRGVAWEYRPTLARMAMTGRIDLPKGFLEPEAT